DLVTHVREELGLGAGGGERLVARPGELDRLLAELLGLPLRLRARGVELGDRTAELLLRALAVGDVLQRAFVVPHRPVRVAHRAASARSRSMPTPARWAAASTRRISARSGAWGRSRYAANVPSTSPVFERIGCDHAERRPCARARSRNGLQRGSVSMSALTTR